VLLRDDDGMVVVGCVVLLWGWIGVMVMEVVEFYCCCGFVWLVFGVIVEWGLGCGDCLVYL